MLPGERFQDKVPRDLAAADGQRDRLPKRHALQDRPNSRWRGGRLAIHRSDDVEILNARSVARTIWHDADNQRTSVHIGTEMLDECFPWFLKANAEHDRGVLRRLRDWNALKDLPLRTDDLDRVFRTAHMLLRNGPTVDSDMNLVANEVQVYLWRRRWWRCWCWWRR